MLLALDSHEDDEDQSSARFPPTSRNRGRQNKTSRSAKRSALGDFIVDDDDDGGDDDDDDDDDDEDGYGDTARERRSKRAKKCTSTDVTLEIKKISSTAREFIELNNLHDAGTSKKMHELRDLVLRNSVKLRELFAEQVPFENKVKKIISESLKSSLTGMDKFLGKRRLLKICIKYPKD